MSDNNKNLILKKRLNTCRTTKGSLTGIPDDLLIDIIKAWERWTGTAKSFYTSIGVKKEQMGSIIRKGKKVLKEGKSQLGPFVPVKINSESQSNIDEGPKSPIILNLSKNKTIRFYQVSHLVEFLKLFRNSYPQKNDEAA